MTVSASYTPAAFTGDGAEKLVAAVKERSTGMLTPVKLQANYRNGKLMSFLAQHATIEAQEYHRDVAEIDAVMTSDRLREMLIAFRDDVAVMDS